ncbi:hypothetical protein CDL15_Pgr016413 [Punica granatum]|uniref:non-specific serine/threonine protein kinase n=1 Tax=Punica granatum TaxID=22663 RepID=A0A218XRS4_PUNGR|nr:hypothetical protein CDL15_Pgr016413 [Punica granatum]
MHQWATTPLQSPLTKQIAISIQALSAVSYRPMHLWVKATGSTADIATQFSFTINSQNNPSYADGMAFFLASNGWDIPKSSGGGWLGLVSNQHPNSSSHDYPFVAVEFDTFSNDWDPKYTKSSDVRPTHVSIDINSVISVSDISWWLNLPFRTGTDVTNSAQNPPTSSLPGASSNSPPTSSAPGTSRKSKTWIWAITGLGSFAFLGVIIVIFPFRRHRQLGEGGFGKVHEGYLSKLKTKVAIKKVTPNSTQGMKEYVAEVKAVSQLRHRSLVQLVGWRHRKKELLLIYEFMSNGSLDTHLFKGKSLLTWEILYKIAQDMASSLLYLHEEWAQCVVHRDIKCSNIMLDSSFNAKLGDLGLARIDDHGKGSQTTVLAGTMGYMAPECLYTGKASKESDVYSFCVSHWR